MPENNNGGKRFGRRAIATAIYAVLINVAFFYSTMRGIDIDWFAGYVQYMFGALGFLIGGLTATDIFGKFGK